VYVACLKEFHIQRTDAHAGSASLVLSKMSNHFDSMVQRAKESGIFEEVVEFDEKPDTFFPELKPLRTDTGNLAHNMINRIRSAAGFRSWKRLTFRSTSGITGRSMFSAIPIRSATGSTTGRSGIMRWRTG
jgi:hypothetical protein